MYTFCGCTFLLLNSIIETGIMVTKYKNYNDFNELVDLASAYCGIKYNDIKFGKLVNICHKYFWGEIYKPNFEIEIEKLRNDALNK